VASKSSSVRGHREVDRGRRKRGEKEGEKKRIPTNKWVPHVVQTLGNRFWVS
jgi:hypothetical protein